MHDAAAAGRRPGTGMSIGRSRWRISASESPPVLAALMASFMMASCFAAADRLQAAETAAGSRTLTLADAAEPISGRLVICGGGGLPIEILTQFVEMAGGREARIVVVTTASVYAGTPAMESRLWFWREQESYVNSIQYLHTRSREIANDAEFSACLEQATGVWFVGGNQNAITDAFLGTLTEQRLLAVQERGGVIGGTSAGAAIMSRTMIAGGMQQPVLKTGLGFVPGAIVDQHFVKRKRLGRLLQALSQRPGLLGIGVDEGTALIVENRQLSVLGESVVTLCLPAANGYKEYTETLNPGDTADLVALSRAAIARQLPMVADQPMETAGTMVLCGDERAPSPAAVAEFVEAAGGPQADVVLVTAGDSPEERAASLALEMLLRRAGVVQTYAVSAVRGRDLLRPEHATRLNRATGVWVLADAHWKALELCVDRDVRQILADLLHRGGVLGGNAASAEIQGSLVAAPEIPPTRSEPVAEVGYTQGLGLLPGLVIQSHDDHTAPNHAELLAVKSRYPELLAVDLPDSSALVVRGAVLKVCGTDDVAVFGVGGTLDGEPSRIRPGERFDLTRRQLIRSEALSVVPLPVDPPMSVEPR